MEIRLINNLEVNKEIHLLPNGIYGYVYGFLFSKIQNNDFTKLQFHKRQPSDGEKQRYVFEVRKLNSDDIKLVGYISDEAQLRYSQEGGFSNTEITVFPSPYSIFKNRIGIQLFGEAPLIQERDIEDDGGNKITVLEVKKRIQPPRPALNLKESLSNKVNREPTQKTHWFEKLTNNQTFAIVVGSLLVIFILYGLYLYLGLNLSQFK